MTWTPLDLWIVATGALAAMACALLGNFLLVRRMSMMGDAISHSVLPGIAVAFFMSGSRASLPMFIGAAIVGVLTALLTQWIHSLGKVEQSASMGVVFTLLFAIGLILIVQAAGHVDLDPGCVLYGAIEMTPLDTWTWRGIEAPRATWSLGGVLLVDLLVVVLLFKELKVSSFDPGLATTLGINATLMHYLLMTLVAVTTVAAFESVGSILVIAMLIVPACTAHLLTDRLWSMIVVSMIVAGLSAPLGHYLAVQGPGWVGFEGVSTLTAGMMAVVSGGFFLAALLLAPTHGLMSKAWHRAALSMRIVREDYLGFFYRLEESGGAASVPVVEELRRVIGVGATLHWITLRTLLSRRLISRDKDRFRMTQAGGDAARKLVRSHRLWENYLLKHLGTPAERVHFAAGRLEHVTTPAVRGRLTEATGGNTKDPHGRDVPHEGDGTSESSH